MAKTKNVVKGVVFAFRMAEAIQDIFRERIGKAIVTPVLETSGAKDGPKSLRPNGVRHAAPL